MGNQTIKSLGRYHKGRALRYKSSHFLRQAVGYPLQSLTQATPPIFSTKQVLGLFIIFTLLTNCAQKKHPIKGETEFQKEINAYYKDASKSPLKDTDRKKFTSLDFFKFDSTYVITAQLKQTPNTNWFNMKTTTSRISKKRVFGILSFQLNEKKHELNIYQDKELITQEGFEDYLFLPFLDETNGLETYGGGRYIDAKIPKSNTIEIDFNKAYNPYCVYNQKYSCPIVPIQNRLKTRVEAGVKVFEKH